MKKIYILALLLMAFQSFPPVIVITGQSNADNIAKYVNVPGYDTINCAVGGTSVTRWQKGQPIYQACIDKVAGRDIAGIFHFQGEADSRRATSSAMWSQLTLQFLNDFRNDTDSWNAKVVYAQLGTLPTDKPRPYWGSIQLQQANFKNLDSHFILVVTKNVTPYCPVTGPHWCPTGYQLIATKFENKFIQ